MWRYLCVSLEIEHISRTASAIVVELGELLLDFRGNLRAEVLLSGHKVLNGCLYIRGAIVCKRGGRNAQRVRDRGVPKNGLIFTYLLKAFH